MAESKQNSNHGTILRVKRKCTDDPFHAFVVQHSASKRKKNCQGAVENTLFQLAGTLADNNIISTKKVLENLPRAQWTNSINSNVKNDDKVNHRSSSKYKVIPNGDNFSCDRGTSMEIDCNLFDIEPSTDHESDVTETDIMCNSVKLIREKLKLDDTEGDSASETEYVYDLYYTADTITQFDDETLDIEFYEDVLDDAEFADDRYCDEDDSNDESNWRNDYPDEDAYESSGNEGALYSTDSDDDVYGDYRGRKVLQSYNSDIYSKTVVDYSDDDEV